MDFRQFFFKNRSYTPLPLAFAIIFFSKPSGSATIIGFLLVLVGEIIRLNGVHHAGGATRTRKVGAPALCTSGLFGYVRNPLYLGNIIIYAGVVLVAGGPFMWQLLGITVAFFFLQYGLIISLEEEILMEKFVDLPLRTENKVKSARQLADFNYYWPTWKMCLASTPWSGGC